MAAKLKKLRAEIRAIPRRQMVQLTISHLALLAACLWGGFPYIVLQTLLAAELILISLASIGLYPERGFAKHFWDMVKLCSMLAFVMVFVVISYGVVEEPDNPQPLSAAVHVYRDMDAATAVWALAYAGIQISIALWRVRHSSEPRLTWARENLGMGAVNFLAMIVMIVVAPVLAQPVLRGFASIGIVIDLDILLASLMVVVRFLFALVLATFSESEFKDIASNPYAEP